MQKRTLVLSCALALALMLVPGSSSASVTVSVSISAFHTELAPYGRWIPVAPYGDVWRPYRVAADWQPYSHGEWIYTDYGWTWASYDPWGRIACHYGSWVWTPEYGWVWVPGTVWGPAWVTWSIGDDYIGWAPLPPTFDLDVSGYVGGPVILPAARYVFVPAQTFAGVDCARVRLAPARNAVILARTRGFTRFAVSGGFVHDPGPPFASVQRVARTPIHVQTIARAQTSPTPLNARALPPHGAVPIVVGRSERTVRGRPAAPSHPAGAPAAAPRPAVRRESRSPSRHPRAARVRPESAPGRAPARTPHAKAAAPAARHTLVPARHEVRVNHAPTRAVAPRRAAPPVVRREPAAPVSRRAGRAAPPARAGRAAPPARAGGGHPPHGHGGSR